VTHADDSAQAEAVARDGAVTAPDPIETALLGLLVQHRAGWTAASQLARQLGRPRAEVDRALVALAVRGEAQRMIDWAGGEIIALWRFQDGRTGP
jgi:hypothetical protein